MAAFVREKGAADGADGDIIALDMSDIEEVWIRPSAAPKGNFASSDEEDRSRFRRRNADEMDEDENEDDPLSRRRRHRRRRDARFDDGAEDSSDAAGSSSDDPGAKRQRVQDERPAMHARPPPARNDSDTPTMRRGLGAAATGGTNARSSREATATPTAPRAVPKNFGKFAGTGGLGLKMLMKMGYKPGEGLGASGQGIVEPLQAVRKSFIGEGLDSAASSSSSEGERPAASKPKVVAAAKQEPRKPSDRYKKSSTARRKRVTAKDIVDQERVLTGATQTGKTTTIIDMRSGVAATLAPGTMVGGVASSTLTQYQLSELLGSMTLLADGSQNELRQRAQRRARDQAALTALRDRRVGLEKSHNDNTERIQLLESIVSQYTKPLKAPLDGDLEPLERLIKDVRAAQRRLPGLPLDSLVVALISPGLRALYAAWDPFEEPGRGIQILRLIKPVTHVHSTSKLRYGGSRSPSDATQVAIMDVGAEKRHRPTQYDALLWHIWLPKVRSALQTKWNVLVPGPALDFLQQWYPDVITPHIFNSLLHHVVVPRLKAKFDAWEPLREPSNAVLLVDWLFPWFGTKSDVGLSSHLLELTSMPTMFQMLSHKLSGWFRAWDPVSASGDAGVEQRRMDAGIAQLVPWARVLSRDAYAAFAGKHVVSRLARYLQARLVINPADQSLAALDLAVTQWADCLPPAALVQVLAGGDFFSQWLDVLHQWLTVEDPAQRDLAEVAQWYQTWKAALPPAVVAHPDAEKWFAAALEMMRRAVTGEPVPAPEVLLDLYKERATAARGSDGQLPPAAGKTTVAPPELTFKDVVEHELAENDLVLTPSNCTHVASGRPMFRVAIAGAASGVLVYMDQNVLFMYNGAPGTSVQVAARAGDASWLPCDVTTVAERVGGKAR